VPTYTLRIRDYDAWEQRLKSKSRDDIAREISRLTSMGYDPMSWRVDCSDPMDEWAERVNDGGELVWQARMF